MGRGYFPDDSRVSVYAPKWVMGFSPGFQPRETPSLRVLSCRAWEIKPVDLGFY
jgi:hypothetical protein